MAKKLQGIKGNKDYNRLVNLINDLKEIRFIYVKSAITVKELQELDPNVKAEWDIWEDCYTVYYKENTNKVKI